MWPSTKVSKWFKQKPLAGQLLGFKTRFYFSITLSPALDLREREPPSYSSCKSKLWGPPGTTTSRNSPFRLRRSPHGPPQPAKVPHTQAFVSSSSSLCVFLSRQGSACCGVRCYLGLTSSSADSASGGSWTSTCETVGDPETAMNSPHSGSGTSGPTRYVISRRPGRQSPAPATWASDLESCGWPHPGPPLPPRVQ